MMTFTCACTPGVYVNDQTIYIQHKTGSSISQYPTDFCTVDKITPTQPGRQERLNTYSLVGTKYKQKVPTIAYLFIQQIK